MKAVIFDLDDTLISERDYVFSGYRAVADYLSRKEGFESPGGSPSKGAAFEDGTLDGEEIFNILREEFEISPKNVFNRMYERLGLAYNEAMIMELVKVYREHKPELSFYGDVLPTVESLKEEGFAAAVLTDGYLVTQKLKAEAVGLDRYFDPIVFTDELGREYWKPSIRGFELISEKTGIALGDMVYVGDNPKKDFEIMKDSPIKTVRIIRDGGIYSGAEYGGDCRENRRISSLHELKEALKELF